MKGRVIAMSLFMGIASLLLGMGCGWGLYAALSEDKKKEVACNTSDLIKIVEKRLVDHEERTKRDFDCFMNGIKCRW